MTQNKLRLALMISGGGSTMLEIITACNDGRLPGIEPVCVIASRDDCAGRQKAFKAGIPACNISTINPKKVGSEFANLILGVCAIHNIDIIGQYGWLPKTPAAVIQRYEGMMINQHAGPLDPGRPDFGGQGMFGLRIHCARLYWLRVLGKRGESLWTEAIAQRVAIEHDAGIVLKRRKLEVSPDDNPLTLQQRMLPLEHQVQIETLADFSENRVQELTRTIPLINVDTGELEVLNDAKRIAKTLFPRG